jgi:hypothetical protein
VLVRTPGAKPAATSAPGLRRPVCTGRQVAENPAEYQIMTGMRVRIMPVRGCSHADAATKGMHPPLRQAQSEAMHAWSTTHARTLTGGRCPALFARRRQMQRQRTCN